MKLLIAKWGNSLAVRLPVEYTRAIGAKAGDTVEAQISPLGQITLIPAENFDKAACLKKLHKLRAAMPVTSSTVETMRTNDRY